jgi:two-component system OmpR family sensor kinase
MSLRLRLGLSTAALTLVAVVGFACLSYFLFVRQQERHLHAVLRQDLLRVATLLDNPRLGASFSESGSSSILLQFVAPGDRVVMSWGDAELLPLTDGDNKVVLRGRTYLVGNMPWNATSGTIRMAHDIDAALRSREELARSLVITGLAVALAALLIGLFSLQRSLGPLRRLSREARDLDPRSPQEIHYAGPSDEIGDLMGALNASLRAIRARQEDERAFLVEVAHELAAPLTLVSYHLTDMSLRSPDDQRILAASAAAKELLRTSQDLLVLARGELERPLSFKVVDLQGLLERVAGEYPGIRVAPGSAGEIVGDPERLMQIARNLVRNGIQAAGAAEKVSVRAFRLGDDLVIEVSDEGPGMSEQTLARAFDRLYSPGGRGVGVGLTIAKSLVEQHGGTIGVESSLGVGTRFTVRLPSLESRIDDEVVGAVAT